MENVTQNFLTVPAFHPTHLHPAV